MQARHIKELKARSERFQQENDKLQVQIEKSRDLGKDALDNSRAVRSIPLNRGKEPFILNGVETPTNDELSSGSSSSLSLSSAKDTRGSTKTNSHKRPSQHHDFSDVVSGASLKARREAGKRLSTVIVPYFNYRNSGAFASRADIEKYLPMKSSWNSYHFIASKSLEALA